MDSDKHGMLNRPFRNSFRNRVAMVSPQKAVMPVYYRSDGTGRDSYVIRGSGGMTSEFPITTRADVNFVGALRQQTIRDLPRHFKREDITNYLNCHDARNKKCFVEAARKVANITERLSTNGSMENLHPNTHSPSVSNFNVILILESIFIAGRSAEGKSVGQAPRGKTHVSLHQEFCDPAASTSLSTDEII